MAEAASYLDVPTATLYAWGYRGSSPLDPVVSFVGLVDGIRRTRADSERWLESDGHGEVLLIRLPRYQVAEIVIDPDRGFGQPIFARGAARVEDVLGLVRAGEPLDVVADEFRVPRNHLDDALRVATERDQRPGWSGPSPDGGTFLPRQH